ncbi:MAG: nuclear transport factor 2 family protein [Pseudolabrys sp.]
MTDPVPRAVVDAFYTAYAAGDARRVEEFLADDVQWTISGPVDLLRFCGTRRGKASVLDLIERLVPGVFRVFSFVSESVLVDGDRVATLNRLAARLSEDGRVISYRLAHFLHFRGGMIAECISIIDSYDAAEQVLGHPLTAPMDTETDASLVPL